MPVVGQVYCEGALEAEAFHHFDSRKAWPGSWALLRGMRCLRGMLPVRHVLPVRDVLPMRDAAREGCCPRGMLPVGLSPCCSPAAMESRFCHAHWWVPRLLSSRVICCHCSHHSNWAYLFFFNKLFSVPRITLSCLGASLTLAA